MKSFTKMQSHSKKKTLKSYKKSTKKKTLKYKRKIEGKKSKGYRTKTQTINMSESKKQASPASRIKSRKGNFLKKITTKRREAPGVSGVSPPANIKIKPKKPEPLNKELIDILGRLEALSTESSQFHRARAYQTAAESIMLYPKDITNIKQVENLPGIGKTINEKFQEYMKTGTLKVLERAKTDPIFKLTKVHGIGYKTAKKLVEMKGIDTIKKLRKYKKNLTNSQQLGLKYLDDISHRIPRKEIDEYKKVFEKIFKVQENAKDSSFVIAGSYRRGNKNSGDIDIIISNKNNNNKIFGEFIKSLIAQGILIGILSKGKKKSLTIARLPGSIARRVDFMWAPPKQYAFAILYFTGSKIFNVVMRARANELGYTMSEDGLFKLIKVPGKKKLQKGPRVDKDFPTEKSIFDFLRMVYRNPTERIDGTSVILKTTPSSLSTSSENSNSESNNSSNSNSSDSNSNSSDSNSNSSDSNSNSSDSNSNSSDSNSNSSDSNSNSSDSNSNSSDSNSNSSGSNSNSSGSNSSNSNSNNSSVSSVSSVSSSNNSNSNSNNSSVSKSKKKRNISLKKGTKKKDLTRERLLDFSKEGITFLKKLDEDSLTKMIEEANQQYRNKTIDPTLTDNAYDIMENYVKKSYPHNKSLKQVGAVIDKGMVKLPYYLGSMDKIKPDTKALGRWLKKHKGPYVISGKLDGVSALYSTEGDKPKLWTRGNATKGMDISYLIPYLKGLPRKENIAIRGELIMSIKNFKKHFMDKYKNPRNLISGIVNSKQHEPEKWKYISFVGYEVIKPVLKPKEQMEWLEDNKVKTVKNITLDKITNNKLSEILVKWRNSYKYEVDGIVVSDNRIYPRLNKKYPDHSFAFKMILSDQRAESKVIDVIWTASKDGLLKPVVQYEPVKVKGADLEFATGKNARFIYTNKIGIGALIEVVRRGDVIPNVEKVITPAEEPKMPSIPWEWNAAHIEAILSEKDKKVNKQVISKNIIKFFKDLDVIGLGPGNIKRMIKEGYDTVGDILSMTKEDFLDIDGFKEKKAEKIYNSIQEQISKASLITLMSASNMFGGGIGILSIKKIMKAYPDIVMSDDSEETKIANIKKLNGFESKTAKAFVKHIPAFIDFIDEIGLKKKLKENPLKSNKVIDESHILFGKKIVMTGFRDKELQARIESSGGKLSSKTTKSTFVVLTKDLDRSTGSMKIAEEFNIPIMTPEIFTKKYL